MTHCFVALASFVAGWVMSARHPRPVWHPIRVPGPDEDEATIPHYRTFPRHVTRLPWCSLRGRW